MRVLLKVSLIMLKTRFAPSPTGLLHLGKRTYCFILLLADRDKGIFLLRIEDTDKARSKAEYDIELQNDLLWLDLAWDEGPQKDLGHGPYYQSQRQEIYENYFQQLKTANLVYPCFCSDTELALARKTQLAANLPPRYSGTCADLTAEQINEQIVQGTPYTWRFRVPAIQTAIFFKISYEESSDLPQTILKIYYSSRGYHFSIFIY